MTDSVLYSVLLLVSLGVIAAVVLYFVSKKFYVYVRDPKSKRIKKVSFGMAGGGLRAKLNNPKARQAFSKRHNCPQKKDRTKASYWSCRLPRYAKLLGLKSNFSGFW